MTLHKHNMFVNEVLSKMILHSQLIQLIHYISKKSRMCSHPKLNKHFRAIEFFLLDIVRIYMITFLFPKVQIEEIVALKIFSGNDVYLKILLSLTCCQRQFFS